MPIPLDRQNNYANYDNQTWSGGHKNDDFPQIKCCIGVLLRKTINVSFIIILETILNKWTYHRVPFCVQQNNCPLMRAKAAERRRVRQPFDGTRIHVPIVASTGMICGLKEQQGANIFAAPYLQLFNRRKEIHRHVGTVWFIEKELGGRKLRKIFETCLTLFGEKLEY